MVTGVRILSTRPDLLEKVQNDNNKRSYFYEYSSAMCSVDKSSGSYCQLDCNSRLFDK